MPGTGRACGLEASCVTCISPEHAKVWGEHGEPDLKSPWARGRNTSKFVNVHRSVAWVSAFHKKPQISANAPYSHQHGCGCRPTGERWVRAVPGSAASPRAAHRWPAG